MTGTLAFLLTVAAGVVVGVTDLRSVDVQGPVAVLFSAGFFLAAWHPEGAWRRGLMLGASVPFAHVVAQVTHHTLPYTVDHPASTLLAFVPAMVGTAVGVGVSRLRHGEASSKSTSLLGSGFASSRVLRKIYNCLVAIGRGGRGVRVTRTVCLRASS